MGLEEHMPSGVLLASVEKLLGKWGPRREAIVQGADRGQEVTELEEVGLRCRARLLEADA